MWKLLNLNAMILTNNHFYIIISVLILLMILSYFWCIKNIHDETKIKIDDFLFYVLLSVFFFWIIAVLAFTKFILKRL